MNSQVPSVFLKAELSVVFSLLAFAEPPVLKDWTDEEIMKLKDQPLTIDVGNNTQFIERLVQTVSLLGSTSTDARIREGFAKATVARQKLLPKRRTKADFSALHWIWIQYSSSFKRFTFSRKTFHDENFSYYLRIL